MARPRIYTTPEEAAAAKAASSERRRARLRESGRVQLATWISREADDALLSLMRRFGCTVEQAVDYALKQAAK